MSFLPKKLRDLTRLSEFHFTDLVHIYSPLTGKDHYAYLGDLLSVGGYPDWTSDDAAAGNYDIGAKVTFGLKLWRSLVNNNAVVPTEGANWTEVSEGNSSGASIEITADVSGGTITADLQGAYDVTIFCSANIGAVKTWAFTNDTNCRKITIYFNLTGLYVQTFPAGWLMGDARWNTVANPGTKFEPYDIGKYKAVATKDSANWWMEINQAPYL